MTAGVRVERREGVAELVPPGPPGATADGDFAEAVAAALAALADDPAVRVVVVGGGRDAFARPWSPAALAAGADPAAAQWLVEAFRAIAETPLPTVAAVEGDALGAGLALALACDVRLAAEDSRFGFPETEAGYLPPGGSVARLARLVGRATATRLLLLGEPLSAREALVRGLAGGLYPGDRLMEEARRLAGVIAARGPLAVRYAKEAVARGLEMPLEQALRYETDLTIILQTTADRAEGVRAFVEKRAPRFHGR
jgi:enoyl-CoA hydratase